MDWYTELIDECSQIVTEYGFASRWSKVEGYYLLGSKLLEASANESTYGKGIAEKVAKAIKMSPRTVNYAVLFAKKFPDLSYLPEGKNTSWSKIISKYLTEGEGKASKPHKLCPNCGFDLTAHSNPSNQTTQ